MLIPKKGEAFELSDFRPISLIGGVYKIISKVLSIRLNKVLKTIISDNQSAFIRGKQLLDSVVTLNEVIEDTKLIKKKCIKFKIDFMKAYDSVEWSYLESLMERFAFDAKWIKWMMKCVSSAQASVLVNGSSSGMFNLEKELRQGDPLSAFMYLIVVEGMSILMSRVVENGLYTLVEVGRD